MDEQLLMKLGFSPKGVGIASFEHFGLRIGARARLVSADSETSWGTVIKLFPDEIKKLYSNKSFIDYQPVDVNVRLETGELKDAISYLLPANALAGSNLEYAVNLRITAHKVGLPTEAIETIENWTVNRESDF
ncbi:MAG: hypothetical protein ACI845_000438 [Gammaproteobacteria bacterium]|jgi:hypothetical protein